MYIYIYREREILFSGQASGAKRPAWQRAEKRRVRY